MTYKAVFIDVDGTLLNDELQISPGTKDILGKLSASGVLISVVTARPPTASLYLYEELGIGNNPIICFNGALIIRNNQILHEHTIDTDQAACILHETQGYAVTNSLYRHYDWFTPHVDRWIRHEYDITHSPVTEASFDHLLAARIQPNKILCMGEPDQVDALERHLKKVGFPDLNIHKSKPNYLEIVNRKASKSQGIERVIGSFQIHRQEIIAIGDNFNDVDMLRFAGTSIAMGNAPEEVKKQATLVTDTNNREGIQKALAHLMGL
jgi:Cof subfamily protein (haloacid dehalogenase superfamily)